jgi:tRNA pseudouridine55 synthase
MSVTSTDVLLLVDKPQGVTSHDVVARARRSLGIRRVGHAGTLDPFATGLLILLTGKGTRLIQFVPTEPKVYRATVRFGLATDTDDLTGAPIARADLPDPGRIPSAMQHLTGRLAQLPPSFSAKHVGGTRAYALARRGQSPELTPATVVVHSWELLATREDEIDVRISCGSGTYIRALARDLGKLVNSAAHLSSLRRTNAGPFDVQHAATWEQLAGASFPRHTLTTALSDLPIQVLEDSDVRRVARGMRIECHLPTAERAMLTDGQGGLVVAVAQRAGDSWQPQVVLADA